MFPFLFNDTRVKLDRFVINSIFCVNVSIFRSNSGSVTENGWRRREPPGTESGGKSRARECRVSGHERGTRTSGVKHRKTVKICRENCRIHIELSWD